VCTDCPSNQFQPLEGQTECKDCDEGQGINNITRVCFDCTPGKYGNRMYCKDCPAGKYSNTTASHTCHECLPGQAVVNNSCVDCGIGQYSNTFHCTDCPAGRFSNSTGSPACTPCAAGYFQNATAASGCLACPAGKFSGQAGRSSCAHMNCVEDNTELTDPSKLLLIAQTSVPCAACPAGKRGKHDNTCVLCPAGQYQDQTKQPACKECAQDLYQPNPGQTTCIECPYGQYKDTVGTAEAHFCRSWNKCRPGFAYQLGLEPNRDRRGDCFRCRESYATYGIATFQSQFDYAGYCIGYSNDCGAGTVHKFGTAEKQQSCRFTGATACPSGFAETIDEDEEMSNGKVCHRTDYVCPND